MGRAIEVIDPEGERRLRQRHWLLAFFTIFGACVLGYPELKGYSRKWHSLTAARQLALRLSALKTTAVLKQSALEARFRAPDLVEFLEVSSCGPFATRKKTGEMKLSEFHKGVVFAAAPWVREHRGNAEAILPRLCYDPLYGSSVVADGLMRGSIFLVHEEDFAANRGEHLAQIVVEGPVADLSIE